MNDTAPDDSPRAPYTREALARLVLSQAAADLALGAGPLAVTRNDADTGLGGRASEARQLVEHATQLLVRAVVFERERGASWADIGRYAGLDAQAAEERFAPELARWSEELEVPHLLDEGGRGRVLRLPYAAYAPHIASRDLDLWAHLHLTTRDLHAVSAGLRMAGPAERVTYPETESDEMGGIVRGESRLRPFLELLAHYIDHPFDDTDWETIELGLEPTDDEADVWYSYPLIGSVQSLGVRLARDAETDIVWVTVTGAALADLRLRIGTLFDAFSW
ncbi:hypothetical protein [Streptomyces sp. HD]|uniref:hypothetical protein n=1 Tax=Streptomyces sp. HD TaxID=3020892 RepID=UPI00232E76C0|nr:hypothetical protein [Streptomyces sp. HD]MDC0766142.1 hypothetical protein [Streptomyces sp. HD]